MKKRILALLIICTMAVSLFAGCGNSGEGGQSTGDKPTTVPGDDETTALYDQVMARFTGELESGAVVKVLENDTAIELGYVDQLIEAFNKAYEGKGISAERMNIDQYSDLATDGPYGYGPDVWYQANDILMKYGSKQHLYALPIESMECKQYIPQNAWDAYAVEMQGEKFYCAIPVNVQSGMLYYIESSLPDNWKTDWDINSNDIPDFFETYTALYAFSEQVKNGTTESKTKNGYLDDLVDTYFMAGYLFTYGGYVFGNNDTDPSDIGFNAGNSAKGAGMIRQWAGLMNNTEVLDKTFASAAYAYLASKEMLCTVTTPDVRQMFIRAMTNAGWSKEDAENDLKMINVPRLPVSADLTADSWQDTITNMDTLTVETKMMGGINGYGMSAYTQCPNASLAFIEFATSYEQIITRNSMLGISPARSDAADTIGANDPTVEELFAKLNSGLIDIMPAITEVGQIWSACESFFVDLATDAYRESRGETALYDSFDKIKDGLDRLVQQIYDAIFTLS